MATFNGALFIEEQLESLAAQSRLPDELILCDDRSTDDTLDRVHRFARGAPFRVRVEENPRHLGVGRNFARAISLCSGDLVFLSDQDDVWLPNKLSTIEHRFDEDASILLTINDAVIVDSFLNGIGVTKLAQIRSLGLLDEQFVTGCCTAFRSSLRSVALPLPDGVEDHDGWLHRVANYLGARLIVEESLQLYRRHGRNTSNWIANRSDRVSSTYRLVIERLGQDASDACRETLQRLNQLQDCLESLEPGSTTLENERERISIGLERIEWERRAAIGRLELLKLPRHRRWGPAIDHLYRGFYKPFSGWRSLLKDLLVANRVSEDKPT